MWPEAGKIGILDSTDSRREVGLNWTLFSLVAEPAGTYTYSKEDTSTLSHLFGADENTGVVTLLEMPTEEMLGDAVTFTVTGNSSSVDLEVDIVVDHPSDVGNAARKGLGCGERKFVSLRC